MTPAATPRGIGHVGLTVHDLDEAVGWYAEVLGFRLIAPPGEVEANVGHYGAMCADIFGPEFGKLRIAHMATANGAALELFEFIEPPHERPKDNFEYWKAGYSHICVTDPNVEELAEKIEASGGKIRTSKVWELFEEQPYRLCYCEDPFGSIIEIYSHSHEQTFANQQPAVTINPVGD
jgi:catechol 2,3-dioxygenase-like lactoylglutathione lyase family enzyme